MEMGLNMDVPTLQRAVKIVLRAMLEEPVTLVHCKQGKHHSGSFLIYVTAVIHAGEAVGVWFNEYPKHGILRPHDRGSVLRAWKESGLSELLDVTRRDAEVQGLVAECHTRVRESRRQEVEGSRREQRRGDVTVCEDEQSGHKRPEQRGREQSSERRSPSQQPASSGHGVDKSGRPGVEESMGGSTGAQTAIRVPEPARGASFVWKLFQLARSRRRGVCRPTALTQHIQVQARGLAVLRKFGGGKKKRKAKTSSEEEEPTWTTSEGD